MSSQVSQRSKLITQLSREKHECMICVANIRRRHSTWNCSVCYNVFHLDCIKKWARSSSTDDTGQGGGWRCPGCQSWNVHVPTAYYCFCGKVKNPNDRTSYYAIPHSCGDTCGRIGGGSVDCQHACSDPCHPGRCDPCSVQVQRFCPCGKSSVTVICSSKSVHLCGKICEKLLNCNVHTCSRKCHEGPCPECDVAVKWTCFCGRNSKYEVCEIGSTNSKQYSCGTKCGKTLTCGHHSCEQLCHPFCIPCKLSPAVVRTCPCGQTSIEDASRAQGVAVRKSCIEPIPTCKKICNKPLGCGNPNEMHLCMKECHQGPCPDCPLSSSLVCRCGNKQKNVKCSSLRAAETFLCEKKCSKKRSCGKHKCNAKCCVDVDHICPIVCDRPLPCNNHHCERLCHAGHCPPCSSVSFEELTCECGNAVIYPPVPCGTRRPECNLPCSRVHECDHDVHHNCHSEPECPLCYVLTAKWCHGGHMLRQNILCHIKEVSCGLQCGKPLSCGRHTCPRKCHALGCMKPDGQCDLPCTSERQKCGHPCNAPCHPGECPETKCKEMVDVTCLCGRLKDNILCWKRQQEYENLISGVIAQKLSALSLAADDPNKAQVEAKIKSEVCSSRTVLQLLKCDKECARIERNKKIAEALQLEYPDTSTTFGVPNYSDYMKQMALKNPRFVEMVHEKLSALVMKAQKLKNQLNITYQFEGLKRDKRQLIFEYCEHFGCLYQSADEGEPGLKSPIITASKERSFLPFVSLVDAVFQKAVEAKRKNAYSDVEIQQAKSQILGPAGNLKRLNDSGS